jgi:hypothetical protein
LTVVFLKMNRYLEAKQTEERVPKHQMRVRTDAAWEDAPGRHHVQYWVQVFHVQRPSGRRRRLSAHCMPTL